MKFHYPGAPSISLSLLPRIIDNLPQQFVFFILWFPFRLSVSRHCPARLVDLLTANTMRISGNRTRATNAQSTLSRNKRQVRIKSHNHTPHKKKPYAMEVVNADNLRLVCQDARWAAGQGCLTGPTLFRPKAGINTTCNHFRLLKIF